MITVRIFDGLCLKFLDAMNYFPHQTLDRFVKTFGNVIDLQKMVFVYDGFNSNNYMEVPNKSEPFVQVDLHFILRNSDISDKDCQTYLQDWKTKGFSNRWEYLKYYNINDVKIMISPIDNLITMFFKWKVDMLANITLACIGQCMKFKLLYDDWVRIYPFKRSNQPVITSFHVYESNNNYKKKRNKIEKETNNNNNNDVANEYEIDLEDEDGEEYNSKASIDFTSTFTKFFDQGQLQKQEKEIEENMEMLNIQPELFLPPLSFEELVEVSTNCFVITKQYMLSKTRNYFCQDKKANQKFLHIICYKNKNKIQQN
jgi:hypothetical protein